MHKNTQPCSRTFMSDPSDWEKCSLTFASKIIKDAGTCDGKKQDGAHFIWARGCLVCILTGALKYLRMMRRDEIIGQYGATPLRYPLWDYSFIPKSGQVTDLIAGNGSSWLGRSSLMKSNTRYIRNGWTGLCGRRELFSHSWPISKKMNVSQTAGDDYVSQRGLASQWMAL